MPLRARTTRLPFAFAAIFALVATAVATLASPLSASANAQGALTWGVLGDFRTYVTGTGGGTVTGSDGATDSGAVTSFPSTGSTIDANYAGTASYGGSVTFDAHGGRLHIALSSPAVRITGPTTAALEVTANGNRTDIATITLSAPSVVDNMVTFAGVQTTLTVAGALIFGGSYIAGQALDPITFSFPTPTPVIPTPDLTQGTPTVSVDRTSGLNPAGETVTVTGTGFLPHAPNTTGTRPPLAGSFTGAYVVFGKFADVWQPSAGAKSSTRVAAATAWAVLAPNMAAIGGAPAGAIPLAEDGTFTATLTVNDALKATAGNWGIYTYAGGGATHAPYETFTPVAFAVAPPVVDPGTATPDPVTPLPTTVGTLTWGVDSDFRAYVTGPIAQGTISVTGARSNGSSFTFAQTGGIADTGAGTGSTSYAGAVTFTGHAGALNLTFSNPGVRLTGTSSAMLTMSVNGSRVDLATLNLGAATRSTSGGAVRYSGAPATLTSAGADAFNGFYPAGRTLAPVTVTFGASTTATGGATKVVAAAVTIAEPVIPQAPPASTGIELDAASLTSLLAGQPTTITVGGFQPGETGIVVVLYSTPTVLASGLTADANGVATWTGSLPSGLVGSHTLTFQGSISQGLEFTVPTTLTGSCPINDATLTWGVKEAFRAYIESTIAKGGWELEGNVAEVDGGYTWKTGSGAIEPDGSGGLVAFTGSVRFTGHDGALDTTVANPVIEFSGDSAVLLVDVSGTTQAGTPVDQRGVRFATLDLAGATPTASDGAVTITSIPATLTAEGSAAFGTYPAGESLDAVTLTMVSADGCALPLAGVETATGSPSAEPTSEAPAPAAGTTSDDNPWLTWVLAAAAAVIAAGAVVAWRVRR